MLRASAETIRGDEPPFERPRLNGVVMSDNLKTLLDADALLAGVKGGLDHRLYGEGETLFSQGEASDKVFYVLEGNVKVGVISKRGKEAVVGIFGPGDFLGELCLSGQQLPDIHGDCDERMLGRPHRQRNHAEFARIRSLILNIIRRSISSRETPESKRTSSIICSIPVKNAWRGRSCFSQISARKVSSIRCPPRSIKSFSRKWSERPGRA